MKPLGKVAMLLGVFLHYVMCYVYIFRVTFQYSGSMFIPYVMMLVHLAITLYNQFVFSVTCRAEGEEIPQLLNFNQGFLNFIRLIFLWDLFYFNSDCLDKLKATVQRFEGKWSFWINGARTFFLLRNIAYFIAIKNLQDFELAFFFCYFYAVVNLLLIFHDTKYVVAIICSFILIPFVIIGDCFTALFNKCKRNHQGNARAIERENLENANNAINVANAREDNNNFNNLEGERPRQLFNEIDPENEERLVIQRNNANNVQNNEGFQVNMRNLAFAFMDAANHQKKFLRLNSTLSVEMMMKNWSRKFTEEDTNACPSCCVCLEDFEVGENIMELHCNPKSHGHMFHMECTLILY